MTDGEFLRWMADRLVNVYKENELTDFGQRLKKIAIKLERIDKIVERQNPFY